MKRDSVLLGIVVVAAIFLLAQLIDFGYGRDQGIFAAVARAVRAGGVPYRDAWDFKPPGIFFVYALAGALFGDGPAAIRWLEAAALVSAVGAFAILSREYLGDVRPGILGGGLAVLAHVQLEFWHTAQPESFGGALIAWALALAVLAMRRAGAGPVCSLRHQGWWMAAGVCAGAAALLKPTIAIAAAASLLVAVVRSGWRPLMPFAAGVLLPSASCALFFAIRGGLAEVGQAAAFAGRYASLAWIGQSPARVLWRALIMLLSRSPAATAGVIMFLALAGRDVLARSATHIVTAIVFLLIGVAVQGRLFPYHFGAELLLWSLVGGWGLWLLWLRVRTRLVGVVAYAALVVVLVGVSPLPPDLPQSFWSRSWQRAGAWAHPDRREAIRDDLYSVLDYRARDNRLAAEWLQGATGEDASVFVYGFTPEIYVAAARRPASRYVYDVPLRAAWSRERTRPILIAELDRNRPAAILVEHGDVVEHVVGAQGDSASDLYGFQDLRALLTSSYVRSGRLGKFDAYLRAP